MQNTNYTLGLTTEIHDNSKLGKVIGNMVYNNWVAVKAKGYFGPMPAIVIWFERGDDECALTAHPDKGYVRVNYKGIDHHIHMWYDIEKILPKVEDEEDDGELRAWLMRFPEDTMD